MDTLEPPEGSEPPCHDSDARSTRIAGLVARVIGIAAHDAILWDDLAKTKNGQMALSEALLEFARVLANANARGVGHLIEAAKLARNAAEIIGKGAACLLLGVL